MIKTAWIPVLSHEYFIRGCVLTIGCTDNTKNYMKICELGQCSLSMWLPIM